MFSKLFAESGLSMDRLRALLEVGAAGSIVKAAAADPVRQSQYSRQIKELEDFFRAKLIERNGKGTRLTSRGRELARISRFFMTGLSNFQRGCLAEEQTFRIGGGATFIRHFLLGAVAGRFCQDGDATHVMEVVNDDEIERRLHDLTLDFGIVTNGALSRPLQTKLLGTWKLELWVPARLDLRPTAATAAFEQGRLPLVLAKRELDGLDTITASYEPRLICDSFLEALAALQHNEVAALLPDFLAPAKNSKTFLRVVAPKIDSLSFSFNLAWNPRLMRLNPHAIEKRDWLAEALGKQFV